MTYAMIPMLQKYAGNNGLLKTIFAQRQVLIWEFRIWSNRLRELLSQLNCIRGKVGCLFL
jgi:hypothetical protein